jgi:hypothetical protein
MLRLTTILGAAATVIVAVVLLTGALGSDSQSEVHAKRGGALPATGALNRSDDAGADTLRAYLQGALACTAAGEQLMRQLSGADARSLSAAFQRRCARSTSWTDELTGKLDPDELDARGRARWAVSADGGGLPEDLHVRIRMAGGQKWEIDRACTAECPG